MMCVSQIIMLDTYTKLYVNYISIKLEEKLIFKIKKKSPHRELYMLIGNYGKKMLI